ncbi:MAG: helix-turn-helix domain-containing protein [Elusimicrobia bacterium]|nr:helix-turn-helix domain-containing protein [Elusimicrobiota bacterium]
MHSPRCAASPSPIDSDAARLLKILGTRRLAALQAAFGGRRLWIPKAGSNLRCSVCRHRDQCIRTWRSQGLSIGVIARRLGVSPKTVYRVLGFHRVRAAE